MNIIDYKTESKHGFIFDMEREHWWCLTEDDRRAVPPTPEILRFEAEDEAWIATGFLRLRGWLINDSYKEVEVALFSSPSEFWMDFAKDPEVKEKPFDGPVRPPRAPPPPTVLFVPAKTRMEFQAVIELQRYDYKPGTEVVLKWRFNFWHSPKPDGLARAVLTE